MFVSIFNFFVEQAFSLLRLNHFKVRAYMFPVYICLFLLRIRFIKYIKYRYISRSLIPPASKIFIRFLKNHFPSFKIEFARDTLCCLL